MGARPANVSDYRALAERRLPRAVFDYLEGGAGDERGLRRNREAFDRILFAPRHLLDVSRRDLSTRLFGRQLSSPLVIAPTGLNGALRPDGDRLLARAAQDAGIPFCLSTASTTAIEELAGSVGGDLWFQLYIMHRELARQLVRRAHGAGYSTLVLTVDVAVGGRRPRDMRNGFGVPFRMSPRFALDCALHPAWTLRQLRHGLPQLANMADAAATDVTAQARLMQRQMDASFAWDDLKSLRDDWPRTLLVKGILDPGDVAACFELGVDGVVLSNHGGRQLEDVAAPVDVLAATDDPGKPLLVDSGIRSGADIAKALASGASAVLVGRAVLYGLAAAGQDGVRDVLRLLREELDNTLALVGCANIADLSASHIRRA